MGPHAMIDSVRTFVCKHQHTHSESRDLLALAIERGIVSEQATEADLTAHRPKPEGEGHFHCYDAVAERLLTGLTLSTRDVRRMLGTTHLALHQDRRFYDTADGHWYLAHQTPCNDALVALLKDIPGEFLSLADLMTDLGDSPCFWTGDSRFSLQNGLISFKLPEPESSSDEFEFLAFGPSPTEPESIFEDTDFEAFAGAEIGLLEVASMDLDIFAALENTPEAIAPDTHAEPEPALPEESAADLDLAAGETESLYELLDLESDNLLFEPMAELEMNLFAEPTAEMDLELFAQMQVEEPEMDLSAEPLAEMEILFAEPMAEEMEILFAEPMAEEELETLFAEPMAEEMEALFAEPMAEEMALFDQPVANLDLDIFAEPMTEIALGLLAEPTAEIDLDIFAQMQVSEAEMDLSSVELMAEVETNLAADLMPEELETLFAELTAEEMVLSAKPTAGEMEALFGQPIAEEMPLSVDPETEMEVLFTEATLEVEPGISTQVQVEMLEMDTLIEPMVEEMALFEQSMAEEMDIFAPTAEMDLDLLAQMQVSEAEMDIFCEPVSEGLALFAEPMAEELETLFAEPMAEEMALFAEPTADMDLDIFAQMHVETSESSESDGVTTVAEQAVPVEVVDSERQSTAVAVAEPIAAVETPAPKVATEPTNARVEQLFEKLARLQNLRSGLKV